MANYKKKINYRKLYPDASDEIIEVLEKSDRKMEYQQYDLKVERSRKDHATGIIRCIPSREDSYERLLEENRQFETEGETVEDAAVKAVLIEKMLSCLKSLSPQEQELITEIFFKGRTERQLAAETGLHNMTIHSRKVNILSKLKKLMDK